MADSHIPSEEVLRAVCQSGASSRSSSNGNSSKASPVSGTVSSACSGPVLNSFSLVPVSKENAGSGNPLAKGFGGVKLMSSDGLAGTGDVISRAVDHHNAGFDVDRSSKSLPEGSVSTSTHPPGSGAASALGSPIEGSPSKKKLQKLECRVRYLESTVKVFQEKFTQMETALENKGIKLSEWVPINTIPNGGSTLVQNKSKNNRESRGNCDKENRGNQNFRSGTDQYYSEWRFDSNSKHSTKEGTTDSKSTSQSFTEGAKAENPSSEESQHGTGKVPNTVGSSPMGLLTRKRPVTAGSVRTNQFIRGNQYPTSKIPDTVAGFRVRQDIVSIEKMKWKTDGTQMKVSLKKSAFKVGPGTRGIVVRLFPQITIKWYTVLKSDGKTPRIGFVQPHQIAPAEAEVEDLKTNHKKWKSRSGNFSSNSPVAVRSGVTPADDKAVVPVLLDIGSIPSEVTV